MSLCLFGECCEGSNDQEDERSILDFAQDKEIPVKHRKQTDLPWLLILVLVFSLLVICVVVAGGQGDIRRLINGYDDKGNVCGYKNELIKGIGGTGLDLTGKKFLQTSVECRAEEDCWTKNECVETCKDGYEPSIIPRCAMSGDKKQLKTAKPFVEMAIADLSLCWREIIAICFLTIFLSGLVLTILRMFAKVVIKVILVIVSIAALATTIISWFKYGTYSPSDTKLDGPEKKSELMNDVDWMTAAFIFTTLTVLFLITLLVLRHKLKWIAVLFEEGGKCIKDIPAMLLQPVLTYLTTAVFVCFLCIGFACLQTAGKPDIHTDGKVVFRGNIFFQGISWILLFVFLWLSQFILACQHLVVAGAVSSWYFSRIKGKLYNPVWRSFCMIVKHHLGSAAFGGLLIAIVKAIRMLVNMMEKRSSKNFISFIIWSLVQCLLACMETFLRIISKTAYVMIALFGEPFCRSAHKAFACITSDSSQIALLIGAETFVLTVIELLITVCVTFVGAALLMNIEGLQSFWIPIITVFILSYLCCNCFFSVYNMTVDSLILCFCVDHQMNDGLEKPYYMNNNLKILLNEYSSSIKQEAPTERSDDSPMLTVT